MKRNEARKLLREAIGDDEKLNEALDIVLGLREATVPSDWPINNEVLVEIGRDLDMLSVQDKVNWMDHPALDYADVMFLYRACLKLSDALEERPALRPDWLAAAKRATSVDGSNDDEHDLLVEVIDALD